MEIINQSKRKIRFREAVQKGATVSLVVFYYTLIEQVPIGQRLSSNDWTLMMFLVWQHLHQCLPFNSRFVWDNQGQSQAQHIMRIMPQIGTITTFGFTIIACLLWPLAAWMDFSFTHVDTYYWSVRYLLYLIYIIVSNLRLPAFDSLQMLTCDGFILSQICSILMYNQLSFGCMIYCVTPFLLIQNHNIAIDIMNYAREPTYKSTFVRLMGAHDSTFILLTFSVVILLNSAVDSLATQNWDFLLMWLYLPGVLYVFNRLMDEKPSQLKQSWFLQLVITIGTMLALAGFVVTSAKHPQSAPKEYPLYDGHRYLPEQGPMTEEATLAASSSFLGKMWRICTFYQVRSFIHTWTISPIFEFIEWYIYEMIDCLLKSLELSDDL